MEKTRKTNDVDRGKVQGQASGFETTCAGKLETRDKEGKTQTIVGKGREDYAVTYDQKVRELSRQKAKKGKKAQIPQGRRGRSKIHGGDRIKLIDTHQKPQFIGIARKNAIT